MIQGSTETNAPKNQPHHGPLKRNLKKRKGLPEKQVRRMIDAAFGKELHAKQVFSLSQATLGAIHAGSMGIHAIGQGLAAAQGLSPKHAIKQVDRALSNNNLDVWRLFDSWVPCAVGDRSEIVVALDWTEFDGDDHSTIAMHLVTSHGRATPLLWLTVKKSELKDQRNAYEDQLLVKLREALPPDVEVLVLADRGFGDKKLFEFMEELEFHYLIRFKGGTFVTNSRGERRKASDWLSHTGRAVTLRKAKITAEECPVETVVCVWDRRMKEAWYLASDLPLTGNQAAKRYGRRFTIEETFRDIKDDRYGMGMSATHIGDAKRRDRLFLIATMAIYLLTLLGAAAESRGLDRLLKANTVKRRTHSLFRQGRYWYDAVPQMHTSDLRPLLRCFGELIAEQPFFKEIFGLV